MLDTQELNFRLKFLFEDDYVTFFEVSDERVFTKSAPSGGLTTQCQVLAIFPYAGHTYKRTITLDVLTEEVDSALEKIKIAIKELKDDPQKYADKEEE